jgi:hypothetical protein
MPIRRGEDPNLKSPDGADETRSASPGGLIRAGLGEFLKALNRQRNNFAHRLGHSCQYP